RWHPLADYVCEVAPEIAHKCQYWHTNDGDGLNACDSIRLADRLQAEVDAGRTESYARIYQSKQAAMPKEPCIICGGTGTRHPVPFSTQMAQRDAMLELWELQSMIGDKDEEQAARIAHLRSVVAGDPKGDGIKCNGCYGDGYCEAWECNYVPVPLSWCRSLSRSCGRAAVSRFGKRRTMPPQRDRGEDLRRRFGTHAVRSRFQS